MASGVQSRALTIPMLRRRIAQVDSPAFRATLAQLCAAAAGKFINDGFRRSVDPYGDPWEPLASRKGQPELDTGRLRASFASTPIPGGFRIDATASYAKYQQFGTQPHDRAARIQPIDKRGRFLSRAKAARQKRGSIAIRRLSAYRHGGIPARPMVPTPDQGGIPYKWQRAFAKEAKELVKRIGEGGSP